MGFFVLVIMRKLILFIFVVIAAVLVYYQIPSSNALPLVNDLTTRATLLNEDSLTIKGRVRIPSGFKRVEYAKGSFQDYLRHYKLKPFNSKIINYDNSLYYWQKGHIGILDVPVPENGLQQCADALIRIRSEYLWDQNRKKEIGFNFTSGHYCSWSDYANGFRPIVKENKVTFVKKAKNDHSKANFYRYLNLIYTYSGTLSLYNELQQITDSNKIMIGDMIIKGGSPGHIVMVADEIVNEYGEKRYLLFQGNTPAQSVHLVKNLSDDYFSPWYQLELNAIIPVSNYTFNEAKYVRFK